MPVPIAVKVARVIATTPEKTAAVKLTGTAGGTWELETGWGKQLLKFSAGTIDFVNDEFGPYELVASSYSHPELYFSFAIDKGGWDFDVDFEGTVSEDTLEGVYYPGETPVRGRRISND